MFEDRFRFFEISRGSDFCSTVQFCEGRNGSLDGVLTSFDIAGASATDPVEVIP